MISLKIFLLFPISVKIMHKRIWYSFPQFISTFSENMNSFYLLRTHTAQQRLNTIVFLMKPRFNKCQESYKPLKTSTMSCFEFKCCTAIQYNLLFSLMFTKKCGRIIIIRNSNSIISDRCNLQIIVKNLVIPMRNERFLG